MEHKRYSGYLIDLDGTMYNGKKKVKEAAGFVQRLRKSGKDFLFLSNNSTASPIDVCENLKNRSDVEAYPEEIYTSSHATVAYLKRKKAKRLFLIGESGLLDAVKEAGFTEAEEDVDSVVVGFTSSVTYEELKKATLLIQAGAEFIATNPDTNIPTEEGLVPGNGALIAFVEAATGVKAKVMGKPAASIMNGALDKLSLDKEEVLMVGDNYTTDIQAGIQNDIDSLLVLTGFTQKEDLPHLEKAPSYVINHLDEWKLN